MLAFVGNAKSMLDPITGGVPHRLPELEMVSVESGVGWIPFLLEALDWQSKNDDVSMEHPEYGLLPTEYFCRQIYARPGP